MKNRHPLRLVLGLLLVVLVLSGCVSNRYKPASKKLPPPVALHVQFPAAAPGTELTTLITYNGPGSWKRDACWDEYVLSLHNPGSLPLTLTDADLTDFAGNPRFPGSEPWKLEKESLTLEQQYKNLGLAFVRYTAPAVLIVGAGIAAITSAGIFSAGAATAATATVVALPVYYLAVLFINHSNKEAVETEFTRRRLALPLTLAPGETRTGSFFFPMVPNPRSLNLRWSAGADGGKSALPLDFLRGLHLQPDPAKTPPAQSGDKPTTRPTIAP